MSENNSCGAITGSCSHIALWFMLFAVILLAACSPTGSFQSSGLPVVSSPSLQITSLPPSSTPLPPPPVWTSSPPPTGSPTPSPTPTSTSDPFIDLAIDTLASRDYGGGELQIVETIQQTSYYDRYLVTYPSDGLTIYGFMDLPSGEGPFPVVIALHGYIDPEVYQTLDYTTDNADAIARAGYLVIHPNLRGYPPSDSGPNLFRVGMAIDVLNLIALIQEHAGDPGPLEQANPQALGLWGHSMGGGITTRVITVSDDVDAAVLYGAMSGDEYRNFEAILGWSDGQRGLEELSIPEEALQRISPVYYYDRIQAAVSIHHGGSDELVPLAWSEEMCQRLKDLGKPVECFTYPGQPHTLYGDSENLFNQRVVAFFNRYLKNP